jgi:hypothetical protein
MWIRIDQAWGIAVRNLVEESGVLVGEKQAEFAW